MLGRDDDLVPIRVTRSRLCGDDGEKVEEGVERVRVVSAEWAEGVDTM
jgi:hypothetical protein